MFSPSILFFIFLDFYSLQTSKSFLYDLYAKKQFQYLMGSIFSFLTISRRFGKLTHYLHIKIHIIFDNPAKIWVEDLLDKTFKIGC